MSANAILFWILAVFFALVGGRLHGRGRCSTEHEPGIEWVGTVALSLTRHPRRLHRLLPRARAHGRRAASCPRTASTRTSTTATPSSGFFSPWSWWPIVLAGGAALVLPRSRGRLLDHASSRRRSCVVALVGWVYEYYRGNFAR